jgi:hypothetical protein
VKLPSLTTEIQQQQRLVRALLAAEAVCRSALLAAYSDQEIGRLSEKYYRLTENVKAEEYRLELLQRQVTLVSVTPSPNHRTEPQR